MGRLAGVQISELEDFPILWSLYIYYLSWDFLAPACWVGEITAIWPLLAFGLVFLQNLPCLNVSPRSFWPMVKNKYLYQPILWVCRNISLGRQIHINTESFFPVSRKDQPPILGQNIWKVVNWKRPAERKSSVGTYMYKYIYLWVCVCVCVWELQYLQQKS